MDIDRADLLETRAPPSRFDGVIECLMAALLAFMPFAFGAAEAWAEEVVILLSGAMLLCLLGKVLFRRETRLIWTWAYVPLGLFVLLVAAQLIPLPLGVLQAATPNTVAMKTHLAAGLSPPARTGWGTMVSFCPPATERALRLALAVSAVFVVTVNVYRRASQVNRLLVIVGIIAGGVALLAMAQVVTGARKIYWRVPAAATGGSFVNRNNYCQFMNLSMGAVLGLLLVRLKSGFRRTPVVLSQVVERLGARELRAVWYLSGMLVLGIASVFLSLSRGGMVSLLVAWGVTAAVLSLRKRLDAWGWAMCLLAVGAFVCVLYVSFDSVYDRLASLRRLQEYQGRWALARDSARAWATFPLLGAGLGTHEYVFPMFDQSTILATARHVENEYVQMAEETGIVGLVLIGAFGAVILRSYVRCIRRDHQPVGIAAIGLGAGLLAVLIHSLADFGLHLPSNACLAAVFCGLLVGMARRAARPGEPTQSRRNARAGTWLAAICLAGAAATWAWAVPGAHAARRAEAYWHKVQLLERQMRQKNWAVANADYARLIALARKAVRCQPKNPFYRHWLNTYRWRAVSRVTEPKTGNTILGPVALRSAREIVADLEQALAVCPTFGASYSLAGQLKRFVLGSRGGAELIRTGRALAPCNPAACFADGMLDAHEGNVAESLAAFRRTLELDGHWFRRIVQVYVFQVDRPELAVEIAGDNVGRLFAVAKILDEQGKAALAAKARKEATALLHALCEPHDAPVWALARAADLCFRNTEYERAAGYYRRALSRECGNVMWRLNFARALAAMGQASQARQQAGICLKLSPGMPEAKGLILDLRTRQVGDRDVH